MVNISQSGTAVHHQGSCLEEHFWQSKTDTFGDEEATAFAYLRYKLCPSFPSGNATRLPSLKKLLLQAQNFRCVEANEVLRLAHLQAVSDDENRKLRDWEGGVYS